MTSILPLSKANDSLPANKRVQPTAPAMALKIGRF
jgi:hypothetical protein